MTPYTTWLGTLPKTWTDATVLRIKPPADLDRNDAFVWCPDFPRFAIRFRRNGAGAFGAGTYVVEYTQGGRNHRVGLKGKVGALTFTAAKAMAQAMMGDVARQIDPAQARKDRAAAQKETFATYVPAFLQHLARKGRKTRYIANLERYLPRYFPDLADKPVTEITRKMIADALERLVTAGPCWKGGLGTRTEGRSALSGYYEWLMLSGHVEANPVANTVKYAAPTRERTLTEAELTLVLDALDDTVFCRVLKLLVLTGCRRDQIGWMRREWLDLDAATLTLPGKEAAGHVDIRGGSKNGKPFVVPLSKQAVAILRRQLRENPAGVYVFSQPGAAGGFQAVSAGVQALRARIGDAVASWTPHDLRRTLVSLGASVLRIETHLPLTFLLDVAINHTVPGLSAVGGIYQRNQFVTERAPVMQAWADYCDTLAAPKPRLQLVA